MQIHVRILLYVSNIQKNPHVFVLELINEQKNFIN